MSVYNAYMSLSGAIDADVMLDERMARRTSYRIGGPAALYVVVNTYPALKSLLEVLDREQVAWVVLGRGSNVLVSDEGYDGCVIRLGREFSRISFGEEDGELDGTVVVGAGTLLSQLVSAAQGHGLSGLEACVGIPGSVGGALSMDAGPRHHWIGQRVSSVVTLKPGVGLTRHEGHEIEWGYRYSSIPADEIILEATLALDHSTPKAVAAAMEERMASRRKKQPIGLPTCGSVFRNPPQGAAGAMIEAAGLKGFSVGRAQVSETHANFVENHGGATAVDVISVIHRMHDEVLAREGVDLVPEVKFLGFA